MSIRKILNAGIHVDMPKWLPDNLCYETMMGSEAYGVASNNSDMDVYGAVFPPKELVFPHLAGEIPGFGNQIERFNQWQKPHIEAFEKQWDFSIYSIVRFFQLAMENNPNMLDALFTPSRCVLSTTHAWQNVRDNRKIFLHKGSWHKLKGYAYSQLAKIKTKNAVGKRLELIEKFGYDVKFAYHVVRLLDEAEQILITHDLDIERNREQLKAIRAGEWTLEQVENWFSSKERELETAYTNSTLRHSADEPAIRKLLIDCLEHHYGSLSTIVNTVSDERRLLSSIANMVKGY